MAVKTVEELAFLEDFVVDVEVTKDGEKLMSFAEVIEAGLWKGDDKF